MNTKRRSFVLYMDYLCHFERLSTEEAGRLIMMILRYVNGIEQDPDECSPETAMAFSFIKLGIDRDSAEYDRVCQSRKEASRNRGRGRSEE